MLFIFLATLLYFLPSIIGHDKRGASGIFLLNLFLGWTIIGWVAAMFWACTAAAHAPVLVAAGSARYCGNCGAVYGVSGRFCSACGRPA